MKNFRLTFHALIFTFYLLFSGSLLFAQDSIAALKVNNIAVSAPTENTESIFDELEKEDHLKITLEADFTKLIEKKNEDKYQQAVMSYTNEEGVLVKTALKIKARGKFRRNVCDFPPLKLKFYEDNLAVAGFNPDYESLKLVTHCIDTEEEKQIVLKEYLAYKLYNHLTPRSFQVKLVEITYVDSLNGEAPVVRYGFLIENNDEMMDRIGGDEIEEFNVGLDSVELRDRQVFSMFQFMIGNTDWKPHMRHNVKIIKSDDGNKTIMVPYDFDFAGIVNSSYARPNPDFRQVSILDRIYMDKVNNIEELDEVIRYFKKQKNELFEIVKNTEGLEKKNKREVLQYLRSFYNILDDRELSRQAFVNDTL